MSLYNFMVDTIVYYTGTKDPMKLPIPEDCERLEALKSLVNEALPETDNRLVSKISYRENWSIDVDGRISYNVVELKCDNDMKDMWKSHRRKITKGPIEFEVNLTRSAEDVLKMLVRPESSARV
ncbi:uncharacterized protein LOC131614028 [Vicia villosa]|uniref:uncharacterized protein LOC131614028 n=1 Tax=Vicia villosa TaxID=3911 RepID=UPI00273A8B4E|nr:uncharacterized protein LOC131614028 [Vicia villosa]